MRVAHKIQEQVESPASSFSDSAVRNALTVERLLERANAIRRARGGLFGYDFEDWLQATRELAEEHISARPTADPEYRVFDCDEF